MNVVDYIQDNAFLLPIFQELEKLMDKDYEIWIKPLRFSYTEPILTVTTPNEVWKKEVEKRFQSIITDLFLKHTGTAVKIVYTISEQPSTTTDFIPVTPVKQVNPFANRLDPEYTFNTFVESSSNRFAYRASMAVAADVGSRKNNPLFIYSSPGLGKTHLLHAIGNQILMANPQAKVLYMTGEEFVNEYIREIFNNNGENFRQKYRSLDCFLIDDIQFVVGKDKSEQAFFHTFNSLLESGKQIVLSSDRTPQQLEWDERFSSRLLSGLVTDIKRPDLETRIAILRKKSDSLNFVIGNDVLFFLAEGIKTSIRVMEGALKRLRAFCSIQAIPPTIEIAKEILSDVLTNENNTFTNINSIKKVVGKHFSVKIEDFSSKSKIQTIAWPRQIAMYLACTMTDLSLPEIGREFNRDHSTVVHARDLVKDKINTDPFFTAEINQIISDIKAVDNK